MGPSCALFTVGHSCALFTGCVCGLRVGSTTGPAAVASRQVRRHTRQHRLRPPCTQTDAWSSAAVWPLRVLASQSTPDILGTYLHPPSLPRSRAPSLSPPIPSLFSSWFSHVHIWRQRNAKRSAGMRQVLSTWPDKILCQLGSRSSSWRGWRFIFAPTACLRLPWCRLLPSCAVRLCKSSSCLCENSECLSGRHGAALICRSASLIHRPVRSPLQQLHHRHNREWRQRLAEGLWRAEAHGPRLR
jgi:hypothetical protein